MRLLRIAEPLAVQEHRRDALSPKVGKEASELIILRWDRIGPARSHRRGAEPERRRAWGLR